MEKNEELTIEDICEIWADNKETYDRFLRKYPELRDFFIFRYSPDVGCWVDLTKHAKELHDEYESDGPDMGIIYNAIMERRSKQRLKLWQRWFKKQN